MNLGQAVAICLYELRRDAAAARMAFEQSTPAPAQDLDRLTGVLLDVLARSGYVQDRSTASIELKTPASSAACVSLPAMPMCGLECFARCSGN